MLKKTLFVGGAALLLLGLTFGRTHVQTMRSIVSEKYEQNIPVEYKIRQAKEMIKALKPEIERNELIVANQEVEVEKLERELGKATDRLTVARNNIDRLRGDLAEGGSVFVYASKSYTKDQVEQDLTRRFDRFKVQQQTADKLDKILTARRAALKSANDQITEMRAQRRQLEVELANLEARLASVQVAQTSSELNLDDSKLSQTREMIEGISTRIDVAEKLVNASSDYVDQIDLNEEENQNIVDEIAHYFGEDAPAVDTIALD